MVASHPPKQCSAPSESQRFFVAGSSSEAQRLACGSRQGFAAAGAALQAGGRLRYAAPEATGLAALMALSMPASARPRMRALFSPLLACLLD